MTELDFEELDKAVSSLMKDVATPEPSDASSPKNSATAVVPAPEDSAPADSDESSGETSSGFTKPPAQPTRPAVTGTQPASLAAKRRGKVMDVVRPSHPISDVKKPVKRKGVSLQPLSGTKHDAGDVTGSAPVAETQQSPAEGSAEQSRPDTSYLDTLTFEMEREETFDHSKKPVETPVGEPQGTPAKDFPSTDAAEPVTEKVSEDIPEEGHSKDHQQPSAEPTVEPAVEGHGASKAQDEPEDFDKPLVSPFLTDTRVEKRPLGGNLSAQAEHDEPDDEKAPETHKTPMADMPGLPEELSSEVMRVESGQTNTGSHEPVVAEEPQKEEVTPAEPEKTDASVESPTADTSEEKATVSDEPKREAAGQSAVPAIGGSITHQYKEKLPTVNEDAENVAIYDTAAYHQPLAHPVKRKSGLAVVLWILLIALIGVGLGVAAFYFTISQA